MGFYFRKSFTDGPLRFNLSKRGIGASVGIPGFRIGTGPRGSYVHMGRYGLYYRASLNPIRTWRTFESQITSLAQTTSPHGNGSERLALPPGFAPIDSGAIHRFPAASVLQNQLDEAGRTRPSLPLIALALVIMMCGAILLAPAGYRFAVAALVVVISLPSLHWAHRRDVARRNIALAYALEPDIERAYAKLLAAFDELRTCGVIWHIDAVSRFGAQSEVSTPGTINQVIRTRIQIGKGMPGNIVCNLEVPALPAGRQVLYFLPDQVLISEHGRFGSVDYGDLEIVRSTVAFLDSVDAPVDAEVLERRWLYSNKDGSPDLRRKNNRQVPVLRLIELRFRSKAGLDEVYQVSRSALSTSLEESIREMASIADGRIPTDQVATDEPKHRAAGEAVPDGHTKDGFEDSIREVASIAIPRKPANQVEAVAKSAARTVGSTIGREIVRGVLGSLLGGRRR